MSELFLERGRILLAEPFMVDPNFKRAAVLLCDHSKEEGSVGFILNRPLQTKIDELIDDFPDFDAEVFFGGPVQMDSVHYLHSVGDLLEGSVKVAQGVYWGGDFEKLKFLIHSELINPNQIRFFVGYAGWSDGQLLDEMGYGSWLLATMDANYLFNVKPEALWQSIMTNKGDTFAVIAQVPEDYTWN
ncbi:YqgE/AlgH family protein [Lewinella sp. LCG006]|uniref:YqgE/AlgH family protein n=1 Tax=Lewinella sp. LCG006 TaxID=3231911 RepID=UPI00345FAF3F